MPGGSQVIHHRYALPRVVGEIRRITVRVLVDGVYVGEATFRMPLEATPGTLIECEPEIEVSDERLSHSHWKLTVDGPVRRG